MTDDRETDPRKAEWPVPWKERWGGSYNGKITREMFSDWCFVHNEMGELEGKKHRLVAETIADTLDDCIWDYLHLSIESPGENVEARLQFSESYEPVRWKISIPELVKDWVEMYVGEDPPDVQAEAVSKLREQLAQGIAILDAITSQEAKP